MFFEIYIPTLERKQKSNPASTLKIKTQTEYRTQRKSEQVFLVFSERFFVDRNNQELIHGRDNIVSKSFIISWMSF